MVRGGSFTTLSCYQVGSGRNLNWTSLMIVNPKGQARSLIPRCREHQGRECPLCKSEELEVLQIRIDRSTLISDQGVRDRKECGCGLRV